MAEGGHSSPIVSPSMNGLTSDKIMEIADDLDVFTQFYDQLQKESRGITSSTPIRSTSNTGINLVTDTKFTYPLSDAMC